MHRNHFVLLGMIGSIAGLAIILAFILYAWSNTSGHTGMHPYQVLGWFIPLAVLGGFLLKSFPKGNRGWKWGMTAFVVGVLGVALLVYFDVSNTLLSYGMWADRHG